MSGRGSGEKRLPGTLPLAFQGPSLPLATVLTAKRKSVCPGLPVLQPAAPSEVGTEGDEGMGGGHEEQLAEGNSMHVDEEHLDDEGYGEDDAGEYEGSDDKDDFNHDD